MGEVAFKLDLSRKYTYADYATWPEDFRCELIDGQVYLMSPSPSFQHQELVGELFFLIKQHLRGKSCKPVIAPFDLRLPRPGEATGREQTVLQPDILVTCHPERLTESGHIGAPDWVIEVLSPSTASKDHVLKRHFYEAAGVREYWLVHPLDRILTRYVLGADGRFGPAEISALEGSTASQAVPEVVIDWSSLTADASEGT